MIPIYTKSFGINKEIGLEQQLSVYQLTIDAESEIVVVVYKLEFLSPTGIIVKQSSPLTYTRYNRPDILWTKGDIIPEVIDLNGNITTPATVASGIEIKIKGNMKFDLLKGSSVGQMIVGMIRFDIDSIQGLDTINTDLAQY